MPRLQFSLIADVVLTTPEFLGVLAGWLFFVAGTGILLILAGRSGMKSKDISPGWRVGYGIWFYGGFFFIAAGVGFPLLALAVIAWIL